MQKLQDSVFSIVKTTNLSPAVFSFLQPSENLDDKTPLGGILKDTKHGWLALGPKFCVVDLRTGLKVAARTFGTASSGSHTSVTSVVELPTPLTNNSQQLVISLQTEDVGMVCVLHINGSQILQCIQTEVVVTELVVCDRIPDGPFMCFDGAIMAGTTSGELIVFDLNRASLKQALKDISQGHEHLLHDETNPTNLSFLPLNALQRIGEQRELALENDHHLAVLLNENSIVDNQYIFRNPDGTVRMKAKKDHIRVTVLQYIPQLGSLAVGYNFGAFQIWNLMTLDLEFTSQVNVECMPVTHFGFQEPCDDPRAFCYLWVVFSVIDRFEEEEFPLAVMYSLTYHGKRMLSDTKCLYQDFATATVRFQIELSTAGDTTLLGGTCVSCHTYSVNSTLGAEGEDTMLNICQLVWECWGENEISSTQYGMLLFDLDQWYKEQMPATYRLESNAFMSSTWCGALGARPLDLRLAPASLAVYSHATRLEEHFYPNSLQYNCICLNTSEACVLSTIGIQRQIISSMDEVGPTVLLNPPRLYNACVSAGLTPLYMDAYMRNPSQDDQRRFLLSVALEARLSRFLKRCAHDWATGSHSGAGCTLSFLVDWCWKRAIDLKENARDLTAPLFASSALPDRNVVRCLEHCVQQLTQLTGLLDAVLTKCCNLVVPDALSEMEEKLKGISTVSLYFQVVQWFLRVGLLPERHAEYAALPYPAVHLYDTYNKRRLKLNRLQDNASAEGNGANKSCSLLYIDQLIDREFGGERIHQMWIKGGSECNGLYPPPSLYSLLRLYLLPDIAEEHKHSLVLYLLVDYSMVYDEVRYEAVIRRLMQFPTMFGLSNTAIKATQAFWHLDHRDFDFALDQLQCLTGNTLSEWQHSVVLSSLLAQKKTQAALQYLHVRKPAPIQNIMRDRDGEIGLNSSKNRVNGHDKLEDWQSCCNLYLARGLVFEALDVVRMCVQNAANVEDKIQVLNFFFKGCRNTGHLSKILQVTLLPFEEEVFIKYLENCNEAQTSDLLIMYYLQQTRYIEAERYNKKLKHSKPSNKEMSTSVESLFDVLDREGARDTIVEVVCSSLPAIANTVAHFALDKKVLEPHVIAPKPLSVYVQAKSPKNTFTYKSSFIQDTIENASETWMNKPKMRRGIKRALNIEETPFLCTPKLSRTKSQYPDQFASDSTPSKRAKLDLTGTPKTPKMAYSFKVSQKLSGQMAILLDMPEVQSPDCKLYNERSGADTPQSILKIRRNERDDAPSPADSRYLDESDDEILETASNHTHYSDTTNKHLRFTIPTASESGSTPSPPAPAPARLHTDVNERERSTSTMREKEMDISTDSFVTTTTHGINENHPLESPPKKIATEENVTSKKSYKDSVRARRSLSISANSSLSDDPNTSIESIADIPVTLINPRYSGDRHKRYETDSVIEVHDETESMIETKDADDVGMKEMGVGERRETSVPRTPTGRRGIRSIGESTPLVNRSRSVTPEHQDSPIVTPLSKRITRSRSRTPELSPRPSALAPIPEQPKQEVEIEPQAQKSTLTVPRLLRSKSRTPERTDKGVSESPKLEAIKESPTKSSNTDSSSSPSRRSLRSRSRTPEIEIDAEPTFKTSPRSLRSRSKTPEKLMSPKKEQSARGKKSLSRLVLEANTFAKTKQNLDKNEPETTESTSDNVLECTPMKTLKQVPSFMDVTLSPIVNKSVLQSSTDSALSETADKQSKSADKSIVELGLKPLPAFTTIHETYFEKSVLRSYQSSIAETSHSTQEEKEVKINDDSDANIALKPLPAFATLNVSDLAQSVLHSYESSVAETSQNIQDSVEKLSKTPDKSLSKPFAAFAAMIETDFEKSVLRSYQSSIADTSQEINVSKETKTQDPHDQSKSSLKDNSSLITNDSDVEMKEDGNEWNADIECQETAAVIQKEKEKIVEIVREINEIEGDMSDDDSDSSSDEEIIEGEGEESSSDDEESSSSTDDDIISIKDTDSDNSISSSSDRLQVDEQSSNTNKQATEQLKVETVIEVQIHSDIRSNKMKTEVSETIKVSPTDAQNQVQESLQIEDHAASVKKDIELSKANDSISAESQYQIKESMQKRETKVSETKDSPTDPQNQVQESMQLESDTASGKKDIELSEATEGSSTDPQSQIQELIQKRETEVAEPKEGSPTDPQNQLQESMPIEDDAASGKKNIELSEANEGSSTDSQNQIHELMQKRETEVSEAIEVSPTDPQNQVQEWMQKKEIKVLEVNESSATDPQNQVQDSMQIDDVTASDEKYIERSEANKGKSTYPQYQVLEWMHKRETEVSEAKKASPTDFQNQVEESMQIEDDTASGKKYIELSEANEGSSTYPQYQVLEWMQNREIEVSKEKKASPADFHNQVEESMQIEDDTASDKKYIEFSEANEGSSTDPLNQGQLSILTDDNSVLESDQSISLNYSVEKVDEAGTTDIIITHEKAVETEAQPLVQIEVTVKPIAPEDPIIIEDATPSPKGIDVVDAVAVETAVGTTDDKPIPIDEIKTIEEKVVEKDLEKENITDSVKDTEKESKAPRFRKRTKSTSSNKSTKEPEIEEPKTPVTRKRTQSNASNKSVTEIEQETPENVTTPSRRRPKTSSSLEVRKIITRRASRELSDKMDDIEEPLEEPLLSTPKRRSTRSRSKNIDDNESVASESSVLSAKSKASEDADVKATPGRRGRKSILATKPELSVIPELTVEETGTKEERTEDVIKEYSTARRLTRHQKAVLESWLEPQPSPSPPRARRASTASRASRASAADSLDDDASPTRSGFDVQPIDRLSLLNKTDFEGSPDTEELHISISPESVASDASNLRRSRMARAASEIKNVPKTAKSIRRISVDIADTSDVGSPVPAGGESPVRGRRASFNRACEALHTPRLRRMSTDSRKGEADSPQLSPRSALEGEAHATPTRRARRGSTHSNASQARSDISKRSKNMPVVEEITDDKV